MKTIMKMIIELVEENDLLAKLATKVWKLSKPKLEAKLGLVVEKIDEITDTDEIKEVPETLNIG